MADDFKDDLEAARLYAEEIHRELKRLSTLVDHLDKQVNRAIGKATGRLRLVETAARKQRQD